MQRIAYLSSASVFRNYFYYNMTGSISDVQTLVGGELYYIEVFSYHATNDGTDNLLVSVEVPIDSSLNNNNATILSVPEV